MTLFTRFLRRVVFSKKHSAKTLSSAGLLLAMQLTAPSAMALSDAEAANALDQIHMATINSYYSANGFYNFSASQGDRDELAEVTRSISEISELITSLEGSLSTGATSEPFKSSLDGWKKYQSALNKNIDEVLDTGYPDLRMVSEMATTNISFNEALGGLHTTIINSSNAKPSKITKLSRELEKMIALMMTKYSARTTSTVGQAYSKEESTELTIDGLAKNFDKKLNELISIARDNKEASRLLDKTLTKWEFIRSYYINYNENRVKFVINLNSKKIISLLEEVSAASK